MQNAKLVMKCYCDNMKTSLLRKKALRRQTFFEVLVEALAGFGLDFFITGVAFLYVTQWQISSIIFSALWISQRNNDEKYISLISLCKFFLKLDQLLVLIKPSFSLPNIGSYWSRVQWCYLCGKLCSSSCILDAVLFFKWIEENEWNFAICF